MRLHEYGIWVRTINWELLDHEDFETEPSTRWYPEDSPAIWSTQMSVYAIDFYEGGERKLEFLVDIRLSDLRVIRGPDMVSCGIPNQENIWELMKGAVKKLCDDAQAQ